MTTWWLHHASGSSRTEYLEGKICGDAQHRAFNSTIDSHTPRTANAPRNWRSANLKILVSNLTPNYAGCSHSSLLSTWNNTRKTLLVTDILHLWWLGQKLPRLVEWRREHSSEDMSCRREMVTSDFIFIVSLHISIYIASIISLLDKIMFTQVPLDR